LRTNFIRAKSGLDPLLMTPYFPLLFNQGAYGSWAEVVRSMIDQENKLVSDRVGWLTTVQGLLFAGLGFAWDKPTAAAFIRVLCSLGVSISVIVLLSLVGATQAQVELLEWWDANRPSHYTVGERGAGWFLGIQRPAN